MVEKVLEGLRSKGVPSSGPADLCWDKSLQALRATANTTHPVSAGVQLVGAHALAERNRAPIPGAPSPSALGQGPWRASGLGLESRDSTALSWRGIAEI